MQLAAKLNVVSDKFTDAIINALRGHDAAELKVRAKFGFQGNHRVEWKKNATVTLCLKPCCAKKNEWTDISIYVKDFAWAEGNLTDMYGENGFFDVEEYCMELTSINPA